MRHADSALVGALVVSLCSSGCGLSETETATPTPHPLSTAACGFRSADQVMTLLGDCVTAVPIVIPDGHTLDGAGHTITATDPAGGSFAGGIVRSGGAVAHVTNLTVTAAGLSARCHSGNDRLAGIVFQKAGGSITHSRVVGIHQRGSACGEGIGIWVHNLPRDYFRHLATKTVEIAHNQVDAYQKSAIVVNGDVDARIHHNQIGAPVAPELVPAISVQFGYAALGEVSHNQILGSQWLGAAGYSSAAVLLFGAGGPVVRHNNIRGNSDVGIYVYGGPPVGLSVAATVDNNRIFDEGADGPHGDVGIVNQVPGSVITNNKVAGFDTPYEGVGEGNNKAIPGRGRHAPVEEPEQP